MWGTGSVLIGVGGVCFLNVWAWVSNNRKRVFGGIWGNGGGKSAHFCKTSPRAHPRGVQNGTDLSNY